MTFMEDFKTWAVLPRNKNEVRDVFYAALVEFLATAIFVLLGAGSVVTSGIVQYEERELYDQAENCTYSLGLMTPARLVAIALAHGFAIVALVYSSANISGGHLNPAVSLSMGITGNLKLIPMLIYMIAQFAGGILGAALLAAMVDKSLWGALGAQGLGPFTDHAQGILVEIVLTFCLVLTVFS